MHARGNSRSGGRASAQRGDEERSVTKTARGDGKSQWDRTSIHDDEDEEEEGGKLGHCHPQPTAGTARVLEICRTAVAP